MKLLGDMFIVDENPQSGIFRLHTNASHPIYKDHFPQHPVTPGVCIVKLIEELTEQRLGVNVQLKRVKNLKFIQPIIPSQALELEVGFQEMQLKDGFAWVKGAITSDGVTFTKFSLLFEKIN